MLLSIALAFYCAAAVLYIRGLFAGSVRAFQVAAWSMAPGLCAHIAGIGAIGIQHQRPPFVNLFESLSFTSAVLVGLYLLTARKHRIGGLGLFVCSIAVLMLALGLILPRDVNLILLRHMENPWSTVHILACLVSYSALILAFGAASGYILQEHLLKTKRLNALRKHLPSLDVMDHLGYKMVSLGFTMLTLGIITGSLWAATAWGSYWHWDSKETWSLITWLVYAVYLHVRIVRGWRGKWANRLLLAGFMCIIITYFGVTFAASSLHGHTY